MLENHLGMLVAILWIAGVQAHSDQEFTIQESIKQGTSVEISTSINLNGSLSEPPAEKKHAQPQMITIRASGQSHYRERILEVAHKDEISLVARRYLAASLEKQRGESKQRIQLRSDVWRIALARIDDQSTIFSPDGPLTAPEHNLLRAEPFVPALKGLLPPKPSKIADQWQATTAAASELTGVAPIQSGGLLCVFKEVKVTEDATVARINFSGTLMGPTDQGPARLSVEGYLLFDLDQQFISSLVMNGRSEILDSAGRAVGRLEGRYELKRRPAIDDPRLTDSALASLELKPTPVSTALLFDGSNMGIQFQYARNWELASITKSTVEFDEATGGNMRLTIESTPGRTADKLRSELLTWLKQQKATITADEAVTTLPLSENQTVERFSVRAEHQQKNKEWTYLLIRDKERTVSIASNIISDRADVLRDDLLVVARSLKFVDH